MSLNFLNFYKKIKNHLFWIQQHKLFYYILFLLFQWISYFSLGKLVKTYSFNLWSPEGAVDSYIPFLPFMVIPYLFYTPLLISPVFFSLKKRDLNKLAGQLLTASLITYLCSVVISTEISPRVLIPHSDHFFLFLIKQVYQIDADSLLFPSLHVMHPMIMSFYLWKIKHNFRQLFLICSIGLAFSTVFVKQHFFLDSIAGVVCAAVIYYISAGFLTYSSCKTENQI